MPLPQQPLTPQSIALAPATPMSESNITPLVTVQHSAGMAAPTQTGADGGGFGLRNIITIEDVILYLRRYWRISAIVAGAIAALLLLLLTGRTPLYLSQSHLQIILGSAEQKMPFATSGVPENSAINVVNNHKVGLQTRKYREYLYEHMNKQDRDDFMLDRGFKKPLVAQGIDAVKSGMKAIPAMFAKKGGTPPPDWERELFIKKLGLAVRADEIKESYVIRVAAQGPNRQNVSNLANDYVNKYAEYLADVERQAARANYEFLKAREEEYRGLAVMSRQDLNKFRIDNDVMDTAGDGAANNEVKSINEERAKIRLEFTTAESVLVQVEQIRGTGKSLTSIPEITKDANVQDLYRRLQQKQGDYAASMTLFGEKNIKTREAAQEIESLNQLLELEAERAVNRFESVRVNAQHRLATLEAELTKVFNQVLTQDQKAIELSNKIARANSDQQTYTQILTKLNEAKVEMETPKNSEVKVIDTATPAEMPFRPNKPLSVIISIFVFGVFFLGLPLGIGLTDDMSRRFGIRLPFVHRHLPKEVGQVNVVDGPGGFLMLSNAFSPGPAREELFKIATYVDREALAETKGCKMLLITSAREGEGKSFMAATLGGVYSSQGRKTLIIDCNLYSPSMANLFPHLGSRSNLVEWLEVGGKREFKLDDLRHGSTDLYVLPARGWAMEPHKLLEKECFLQMLKHARREFEFVILDGPAVNGRPDALILAKLADAALLVSDRQMSDYRDLSRAVKVIKEGAEGKLLGIVSNRADQPALS